MNQAMLLDRSPSLDIGNTMSNTFKSLLHNNLFYRCTLNVTNCYFIIYILFLYITVERCIDKKYKWLILMSNISNTFRKALCDKGLQRYSSVLDE